MIRLDDQVAVITGAGRGIGREYALLLAQRGATVVVNDIGADVNGDGQDESVAQQVVDEITAAGGRADADTSDIATEDGGRTLMRGALERHGRVDVFVHNAGSLHRAPFEDFPVAAASRLLTTHLLGAFHAGQPAWRAMLEQGYGRVLLTTSVALFGAPDLTAYSAAKAGCVGLVRALALEAERSGADVKANAISPTAATRRAARSHADDAQAADLDEALGVSMDPRNVAVTALPLLAPECPYNGACIKAGGGLVASIFSAMTTGWVAPAAGLEPEDVADHLGEAVDSASFVIPASSAEARNLILEQVRHAAP